MTTDNETCTLQNKIEITEQLSLTKVNNMNRGITVVDQSYRSKQGSITKLKGK
jgi:hypothetical protein